MRLTDESETKIRESYSISCLFLISGSQHNSFEFSIQLLVIISNVFIKLTLLPKCTQSLHERPSFGIAYYTVIWITNLFKRETVKGQYSHTRLFNTLEFISQTICELLTGILW